MGKERGKSEEKMDIQSSEEIFGGRLLRKVDESEESLESVCSLRIFIYHLSLLLIDNEISPPFYFDFSFGFSFLAMKFIHGSMANNISFSQL